MLDRVRDLFFQTGSEEMASLTGEPHLLDGKLRLAAASGPIQLAMRERTLWLRPERQLDGSWRASKDWILADWHGGADGVAGFLRISSGDKLRLGRGFEACQRLFKFSKAVARRQLEIANKDGDITITPLDPSGETYVSRIESAEDIDRPVKRRRACLKEMRRIFGGPIELLSSEQALLTLRRVNIILREEAYRPRDSLGLPGGLLNLPEGPGPIIVGDLHANMDNLLKILSENDILDLLGRDKINLVFLGDTVHPQGDTDLTQMDDSLLMLDAILKLKARFPRNVFCLRGNHESFDESVGKGGVPQGILLKRRAKELRGPAYADSLAEFFELLPYVLRSKHCIACHGGPPRSDMTVSDLVNIRSRHRLGQEIIWNRVRRPNHPGGYSKRHVSALRSRLGVDQDTAFIVGHTPLSPDGTLWLDVGNIPNHHIVYSANPHNLAVFVGLGDDMVPLEYSAEALLDLTNALEVSEQEPEALAG